jgi:polyferredoxin
MSIALKKAFCSWLCPVGTINESLWLLGRKLFGTNFALPRWMDYPLRSLKYLIAFFFVYAIVRMDGPSLQEFIYSPYNAVADIKLYGFFTHLSSFAFFTILTLIVFSVVVKNFWCRYLCPYGALLGFFSLLSPLKITRNKSTCIDCELCTKACPSNIVVHKAGRVWSDECMSCLECVEVCPVRNTLDVRTLPGNRRIPAWIFGALVVGIFAGITGLAMLTGNWKNGITQEEYQQHFLHIDTPMYLH